MSAPAADDEGRLVLSQPEQARSSGRAANIRMTLATRLAIAMILLVAVTVAAVGWLGFRNTTQARHSARPGTGRSPVTPAGDQSGILCCRSSRRFGRLSLRRGHQRPDPRPPRRRC